MKLQAVVLIALGVLQTFSSPLDAWQDAPAQAPLPAELAAAIPTPPDKKGGWTVLIATRGGVVSSGISYAAATSEGTVKCLGRTGCRSALDAKVLNSLSSLVTRSWPVLTTASLSVCSDCVQTFLIVSLRDDSGKPQLRSMSWDVTTEEKVAPDVRQLFSSVTSNVRSAGP